MHAPGKMIPFTLTILAVIWPLFWSTANSHTGSVHSSKGTNFLACLSPLTPAFGPGTPSFANLSTLGFRNDHAIPAAVVLAHSPLHVANAVRCARQANLKVCARSGGHSLVGKSLCSGVLIDVRPMRHVSVASDGVANVQAGANLGELLWAVWQKRRWLAAGVCPGVGVGGYIFGGGHGPYEGKLGMACDSLVDVTLVDRFGKIIVASKSTHPDLFWGLCGAGGGQFGIVTSFRISTVSSDIYDRGVVFRITWKQQFVGQLIEKWMDYDEMDGDVWFRLEMKFDSDMNGFGACFNVSGVGECMDRLKKAEFFQTPGRNISYISNVTNALDLHGFLGPEGDWGNKRPASLRKAMLEQSYSHTGKGNDRIYQSTFMRKGSRPTADFWQTYADFCADSKLKSIPWIVCQLNLFNNAIDIPRDNAFAHRDAHIITHYIVGGGTKRERLIAYNWMKAHFAPYTSGVYVNYPELELENYAQMYWGKNLGRLQQLKSRYDPHHFFYNPQSIPTFPKNATIVNGPW